jgi:hypothetical protein
LWGSLEPEILTEKVDRCKLKPGRDLEGLADLAL